MESRQRAGDVEKNDPGVKTGRGRHGVVVPGQSGQQVAQNEQTQAVANLELN